MKFYFDDRALNLNHVAEIQEIREFRQFIDYYNVGDAEFVISKDYEIPGVYLIETSKLTHQWTGDLTSSHSFNLIAEIPETVIDAARKGKIRIVIVSIVEGDHYVKEHCDGFRRLTENILSRQLPKFSVLIMAGNVRADEEYKIWCEANNEEPIIEFIGASEGPTNIPYAAGLSVIAACDDLYSKSYNSLNRAPRQHRSEHLFYLADKEIIDQGLVSGVDFSDHRSKFLHIEDTRWDDVLKKHFPRSVDLDVNKLRQFNPANDINVDIYRKSLLTVVTETYFEEPGLFFSEKIFKPILSGSPQITLTQPYAIRYLKDKFNIDLYLAGIDTSFDSIENNTERFLSFHKSLLEWVLLDRSCKIKLINQWKDQLTENKKIAESVNFKKIIVDDIIKSTYRYFATYQN